MHRLTRSVVFTLALLSTGVGVMTQASDAWMGTWKLNVAKSNYEPAALTPKSNILKSEPWEGGQKTVTDGIDSQGRPTHTEISAKYDGKDYPLTGTRQVTGAQVSANTTRVYKRIDDRTYEFVAKVDGKPTTTTRTTISRDGKTRTSTTTGKDAQGRSIKYTQVYEKQ
jgi:hypothetical protein